MHKTRLFLDKPIFDLNVIANKKLADFHTQA